jgi:hypothetical protein
MFKISQFNQYWVMTVPTLMIPKYKIEADESGVDVNLIDNLIKTVTEELEGRIGVRRMSYDTWHWTNHNEMERFLTYYYLKYGNEYPIDRTTT